MDLCKRGEMAEGFDYTPGKCNTNYRCNWWQMGLKDNEQSLLYGGKHDPERDGICMGRKRNTQHVWDKKVGFPQTIRL